MAARLTMLAGAAFHTAEFPPLMAMASRASLVVEIVWLRLTFIDQRRRLCCEREAKNSYFLQKNAIDN